MRSPLMVICILCVATVHVFADSTTIVEDPVLNIGAETYALAFREAGQSIEVWLTMATETNDRSRRTLARSFGSSTGFSTPLALLDSSLNAPGATYNGVPNFNPCDSNEMVFVSDRVSKATGRRSNDIYIAHRILDEWKVERLIINSGAWDDTPVFGPAGDFLYFSSDRLSPGSGRADIFISRRIPGGWSEPVAVEGVSQSDRHETSPFIFDGVMYFSSNASGDQDIWSVPIDPRSGKLIGDPQPLNIAGVNAAGSDEYHPVVSPGGGWFYFSSNRGIGNTRHHRIYRYQIPRSEQAIRLRVTARTVIRDAQKRKFFGNLDSISGIQTSVRVIDVEHGTDTTLNTNAEGELDLAATSPATTPSSVVDRTSNTYLVSAVPHTEGYVSSIDTIVVSSRPSCGLRLEHVIYLDDTTTRKRTCEFTFRTFNVPFFVTAYWCPTTRKYRDFTPCASLFTDDLACEDLLQPQHCASNEAYTYTYTPAVLERRSRGAENCVNYREFNDSGSVWSNLVDRNIEHMRDEVHSALTDPCLQMAVGQGMPVTVTYIGTTDDRTIHPKCMYTGAEYERIRAAAPHIQIDSAIIPFIENRRHFNRGGYGGRSGGNQLLSDLRSLYFAILFDNLCSQTIPQYRDLRKRGLLSVRSRGQAIDQRDLPYALKRAAGVEIRVPGFEQKFSGRPVSGGRKAVLCPAEGCR